MLSFAGCERTSAVPAPAASAGSALPSAASAAPTSREGERFAERQRLVDAIARSGPPFLNEPWDPAVLALLRGVPRHAFVPAQYQAMAYDDRPLPIDLDQTISQPTIVAIMTQALQLSGKERVLEIGTGSGYQAAVLSGRVEHVYTIELLEPLASTARDKLAELGYRNVSVRAGDGYAGWPEHAPFDRIIVTAAPPSLPQALVDQLAEGGILVAPIGAQGAPQDLMRFKKTQGKVVPENLGPVRFVPMVRGD